MRGRPRLGVLLSVWLLGGADAAEAYAQRAEPGIPLEDRVDVVQVDRRLLAVRSGPGGGVVEQRLELGERVLAIRTRGLIGVATTNVRLLGVTSGSSGWLAGGDRQMIQDLSAAAVNDALASAQRGVQEAVQRLTAGIPGVGGPS